MSEEDLCYIVVGCPLDEFYVENTEKLNAIGIVIDRNRERRTFDEGVETYVAPLAQFNALKRILGPHPRLPFVDLGGRQKKA